jgi:hypothetical protein
VDAGVEEVQKLISKEDVASLCVKTLREDKVRVPRRGSQTAKQPLKELAPRNGNTVDKNHYPHPTHLEGLHAQTYYPAAVQSMIYQSLRRQQVPNSFRMLIQAMSGSKG